MARRVLVVNDAAKMDWNTQIKTLLKREETVLVGMIASVVAVPATIFVIGRAIGIL